MENTHICRHFANLAGKGRGGMFLFLMYLHFHSSSSFFPSISFIYLFYFSFLPFSGRRHKMTHKGWCVVKPRHNENTTKFIQHRLNLENFGEDWICPEDLVTSLAPMKYYRSQNQYFPTENVPQLESNALLPDMSSKGMCSIPVRNLECLEKKVRKLEAINSHADLFSSAAYRCLQQESMPVHVSQCLVQTLRSSDQIN